MSDEDAACALCRVQHDRSIDCDPDVLDQIAQDYRAYADEIRARRRR